MINKRNNAIFPFWIIPILFIYEIEYRYRRYSNHLECDGADEAGIYMKTGAFGPGRP
jgi:hypothetical protein